MFSYEDYDVYGDVDEKVYDEYEERGVDLLFAEEDSYIYDWSPDWDAIDAEMKAAAEVEKKRNSHPGPRLHFRGYNIIKSFFGIERYEFRAGFNRPGPVRYLKRMMHRADRRASKELLREALLS